MSGHTKGPWEWRANAGRVYLRTVNRGGLYIMDFVRRGMQGAQPRFAVWNGDDRERLGGIMHAASEFDFKNHPDARLIASAPELLEALQAIVSSLSEHDDEGMVEHASQMISARNAIAKATGAQS